MTNLQEVLDFIQNSELQEFTKIRFAVDKKKSELRYDAKESFRIGDVVNINHKKMDPKKNFRIIKINNKNIKVQASDVTDGRVGGIFTVSPSLLVKK